MRVLHVMKLAGLGGAEVYLSNILPAMNQAGVQSVLLAMINTSKREGAKVVVDLMRDKGLEVIEIDVEKDFSWSLYKKIAQVVREGGFDLVNAHLIHSELYMSMVKRFFVRDMALINTRHGYYPAYQVKHGFDAVFNIKDKFWWIYRAIKSSFNRTITISHGLKKLLIDLKLGKDECIDVVHYGFEYSEIEYDENVENYRRAPNQILIVGRLDPVKGHTFAFQALPNIIKEIPDVKLVVVGSGEMENELRQEVKSIGIEKNVEFMGFQKRVHDFLKNSDVTLIPSFAEGFCAVVLESNFNHTPVVCFDVPALNEIVFHEETGVIIPKFDIDKLSDAIIKLLKDKEYKERLTQNGFDKLNSYFTMNRMLNQTIEVYNRVLEDTKAQKQ